MAMRNLPANRHPVLMMSKSLLLLFMLMESSSTMKIEAVTWRDPDWDPSKGDRVEARSSDNTRENQPDSQNERGNGFVGTHGCEVVLFA